MAADPRYPPGSLARETTRPFARRGRRSGCWSSG